MKLRDLKYYKGNYRPSEKTAEEDKGFLDYAWDALAAGTGTAAQEIAGSFFRNNRGNRDLEEFRNDPDFSSMRALEDWGRGVYESHHNEFEPQSWQWYLNAAAESAPASIGIMGGSMLLGSAIAPGVGSAGSAISGGMRALPILGKGFQNLAKAYQAYSKGGGTGARIARAFTPDARTISSAIPAAYMEADLEAQGVFDQALAAGMSVEEAERAAADSFAKNFGVIGFWNVPAHKYWHGLNPQRVFGVTRPTQQGLLGKVGKFAGYNMLPEGFEEGMQSVANQSALPFGYDPQEWLDSFIVGGITGLGMGGAGAIANRVANGKQPSYEEQLAAWNIVNQIRSQNEADKYARKKYETLHADEIRRQSQYDATKEQMRGSGIDTFMRAISGQESGSEEGDYNLINYDSGATGRFQIMPDNWAQWAQDAGLPANAPMTPENQERVARNKMLEYYKEYGNWRDVASKWYSGRAVSELSDEDYHAPNYSNGNKYPSISEYVESVMTRFRDISSRGRESTPENDGAYLGENGKAEGKYWRRQDDHTSLEGAHPDLPNAIDMLAKWYYDRTGKQLVVTYGTDGEHASGEHSHAKGWKVDVNDYGFGEDGALTTPEGEKGYLADEFIAYGRSLGLGMNWEGGARNAHIDVALDGTQWDGNGDNAGGFNPNVSTQGRANELYNQRITEGFQRERTTPQQSQQEETKPLFDINAEDTLTQKLIEQFALDRTQTAIQNKDADTLNFFLPMLDGNSFVNTEENRKALYDRYGDELSDFVTGNISQTNPEQSSISPATRGKTVSAPQGDYKQQVRAAGRKFLEELNKTADKSKAETAIKLLGALSQNKTAEIENILKTNGIAITAPQVQAQEQSQPAQPNQQEQPVSKNKPPKNILPQPKLTQEYRDSVVDATIPFLDKIRAGAKDNNLSQDDKKAFQDFISFFDEHEQKFSLISDKDVLKLAKILKQGGMKLEEPQTDTESYNKAIADLADSLTPLQLRAERTLQQSEQELRKSGNEALKDETERRDRDELAIRNNLDRIEDFQQQEQLKKIEQRRLKQERQRKESLLERIKQGEKQLQQNLEEKRQEEEKASRAASAQRAREQKKKIKAYNREQRITPEETSPIVTPIQGRTIEEATAIKEDAAQKFDWAAYTEPPLGKSKREKQGRALLRLLEAPSLAPVKEQVYSEAGLVKALQNGYSKGIKLVQELIDDARGGQRERYLKRKAEEEAQRIYQAEFETELDAEDLLFNHRMDESEHLDNLFDKDTDEMQTAAIHDRRQKELEDTFEPVFADEKEFEDLKFTDRLDKAEKLEDIFTGKAYEQERRNLQAPFVQSAQAQMIAEQAEENERKRSQRKSRAEEDYAKRRMLHGTARQVQQARAELKQPSPSKQEDAKTKPAQQKKPKIADLLDENGEPVRVKNDQQPQPEKQEKPKQEPTKSKPKKKSNKQSVKEKLYEKYKVDTHPRLKEHIDELVELAGRDKDTPQRTEAIKELDKLRKRRPNSDTIDAMERDLQEKEDKRTLRVKIDQALKDPQLTKTQKDKLTGLDRALTLNQVSAKDARRMFNEILQTEKEKAQTEPEKGEAKDWQYGYYEETKEKASSVKKNDESNQPPKSDLLEAFDDTDMQDNPYFGARVKASDFPLKRLSKKARDKFDDLAQKHGGYALSSTSDYARVARFKNAEARDNFLRAIEDDGLLVKERAHQQTEVLLKEDAEKNAKKEIESLKEDAKQELYKILQVDRFPLAKDTIDTAIDERHFETPDKAKAELTKMVTNLRKQKSDDEKKFIDAELGTIFGSFVKKYLDTDRPTAKKIDKISDALDKVIIQYRNGEIDADKAYKEYAKRINKFNEQHSPKHFVQGSDVDTSTDNIVADKDLTSQQRLLKSFSEKLGAPIKFVDNPEKRFGGVFKDGSIFVNVKSNKPLGKVFWHESLHWLKANNPELFKQLAKAAGITTAQRQAYLKETGRDDISTPDEINEEILADQMEDVAKRAGLLQTIAGKDRGLIQRAIQWLEDTLNKFIDYFRNPQGKLTTEQATRLADEFGRIARNLVDNNGNKIFRYNNRTHNIEVIDGRSLESVRASDDVKYSFAGKKAKTANLETLKQAKKMEERGADRDKIYETTGWFKGKDGKWRFEIPDNFDKINFDKLWRNKETQYQLDEIYDNPALFAAYPHLKKIKIQSKKLKDPNSYGYTDGTEITINWSKIDNEREEAGETLVHELQHVIQDYEIFSSGGSSGNVLTEMLRNLKLIRKEAATIPNGEKSLNPLSEAFSNARFAREMGEEEAELLQDAEDTIRIIKKGFSTTNWKKIKHLAERYSELSDTVDEIRAAKGETMTVGLEDGSEVEEPYDKHLKYEAYERLGGEQEAREVGRRLFDRDGTPTPHDEDALIIFGGNTYGMIKQSRNKKTSIENGDGELVKDGAMREIFPPSAATANGTTDYWSPASLKVSHDNKGGVGTSGNSVDTNSPRENISQPEREDKQKYSINNNSSESLKQKIKDKLHAWTKSISPRTRARITDNLHKLSRHRILYGYIDGADDIVVDHMQKLIKSRNEYDWEKLLPVVGEEIAKNLNLNATQAQSNYIADWLLTGALNKQQSAEGQAFANAMRNNPAMAEILQETRDIFNEIANMTPQEKLASTIAERPKESWYKKVFKGSFTEEVLDDLHPIQNLVDSAILNATPAVAEAIRQGINVKQLAQLARGRGATADAMINGTNLAKVRDELREQYSGYIPDDFKTLRTIIESVNGDWKGLETYAAAKLIKEVYEYNRAHPEDQKTIYSGMTEAEVDAIIRDGETKFGEAQKDLVHFSKTLLGMQYDSGLLTDNQYFSILKSWKNYVPMAQVFDENEAYDKFDPLKRRHGHAGDTWSPIQTLIAHTHTAIQACERNKVKLELATLVRFGEFDSNISEIPHSNPNVDNVITFRENGKMKYLETPDPAIKRAIDAMQSKAESTWLMKMLKATAGFMRSAYTMANPDFAAGNLMRDLPDAFIHNKQLGDTTSIIGMIRAFIRFLKVIPSAAKSVWYKDNDFIEWQMNGGAQASFVSEDVDYIQRSINDATIGDSLKARLNRVASRNFFSATLDEFQRLSEFTENITRVASYKMAKEALAKAGKTGTTGKQLAALAAREASIDFSKAGRSTRALNKAVLFANAAVQGINQWIEAFRECAKGNSKPLFGKVIRTALMGVIPALLQAAINGSDDDRKKEYEQAPDWEKDTYWIFGGFKIPKGMDFGIRLLGNLTEELFSSKPFDWQRVFGSPVWNALPSLTATLITPAVEVVQNYSYFRGAPIDPKSEQHLPAYLRYDTSTSDVAKVVGEVTGWSPRKIDYLINGYLGFMGRFVSHLPNYASRGIGFDEMPMVRRFIFTPYKNPKIVKDYYEAYEKQEQIYNGYQLERQTDKSIKTPEDYDKNYDRRLHKRIKGAYEQMQEISKKEKLIMQNPNLTHSERKEKLQVLEKRRVAICERVFQGAR